MPEDWDGVYKRLFHHFPVPALQILCQLDATGATGATVVAQPTESTLKARADAVFDVHPAHGEPLLVHIEVQRSRDADLELRLVKYWLAITTEHGRPPLQVVVLPVGGTYTGHYQAGGLSLRYHVVNVPTLDRDQLLASDLAPLALGAHPDPALIDTVVARIAAATTDPDARATLIDLAMLGADQDVATLLTNSIRRHNMANVLEHTTEGQAILDRGRAEGRTEGRTEGEAQVLRALLADKFGESPDLDPVSLTLAAQDVSVSLRRIREATTLTELLD